MNKRLFPQNLRALSLAWLAVLLLLIAVASWTPSPGVPNDYKSPWAVPAVSAFLLLLSIPLLVGLMETRVGRRMQSPNDAAGSRLQTERERDVPLLREREAGVIPDFALQVLTSSGAPSLSADAQSLVERGQHLYQERLRIYRRGVWFLFAAHLAIAFLTRLLGERYPVPLAVSGWILVAFFGLIVIGHQETIRLVLVPAAFWLFDAACVVATAILAVLYAVRSIMETNVAAALPALLAAAAVVTHGVWIGRRNRELRREIMASPPLRLLFLWVFGSHAPVSLFLGFAAIWRFLGPIRLLNGAGFMGDTIGIVTSVARGKTADAIVETPEELAEKLKTFSDRPRRMAMYDHHALLCNDSVWKLAFHTFLRDADVVAMDLRGFSPANQGARYELRELVDCFPADRFVLLADRTTDVAFLSESLREAWNAMAIDSPNRDRPAPICLLHLPSGEKQQEFDLLAIAREGRTLLELLCQRAVTRV